MMLILDTFELMGHGAGGVCVKKMVVCGNVVCAREEECRTRWM